MTAETGIPTQVYQVFIRTSPERLWEAITDPALTRHYFHGARISVVEDRYRSLGPDDSLWADEAVLEADPPLRLVHGWRSLYDPELAVEPSSRVAWEIEQQPGGVCQLTVTHDGLEDSPRTAARVSGPGWMFVLSGLKTLLETGESLLDADEATGSGEASAGREAGLGPGNPGTTETRSERMTGHYIFRLIPPRPSFDQDMSDHERSIMAAHAQYWSGLMATGRVVVYGPVRDSTGAWGLGVLEAASVDELHGLMGQDPAITSGLARYDVGEMAVAVVRRQ
jgi:uncharacterized protein YndB with AHSA1/START domain/uncharacterized protein YciI